VTRTWVIPFCGWENCRQAKLKSESGYKEQASLEERAHLQCWLNLLAGQTTTRCAPLLRRCLGIGMMRMH
jgi:hypothetical protein